MAGAIAGTSILNVPIENGNKEYIPKEELEACNTYSEQRV
jgi:hypothetical protein